MVERSADLCQYYLELLFLTPVAGDEHEREEGGDLWGRQVAHDYISYSANVGPFGRLSGSGTVMLVPAELANEVFDACALQEVLANEVVDAQADCAL